MKATALLAIAIAVSAPRDGEPPAVSAALSATEVPLGRAFELTVVVEDAPGQAVQFPEVGESLGAAVLIERVDDGARDGALRRTYRAVCGLPGDQVVTPRARIGDREVRGPGCPIRVTGRMPDAAELRLVDDLDLQRVERGKGGVSPWWLGAAGLLVAALLLLRSRRPSAASAVHTVPASVAEAELSRAIELLRAGRTEEARDLGDRAVRMFVGEIVGRGGLAWTAEEARRQHDLGTSRRMPEPVWRLLQASERARYSGARVADLDVGKALEAASAMMREEGAS